MSVFFTAIDVHVSEVEARVYHMIYSDSITPDKIDEHDTHTMISVRDSALCDETQK